jgi:hypothetical protein
MSHFNETVRVGFAAMSSIMSHARLQETAL